MPVKGFSQFWRIFLTHKGGKTMKRRRFTSCEIVGSRYVQSTDMFIRVRPVPALLLLVSVQKDERKLE